MAYRYHVRFPRRRSSGASEAYARAQQQGAAAFPPDAARVDARVEALRAQRVAHEARLPAVPRDSQARCPRCHYAVSPWADFCPQCHRSFND